MFIKRPNATRRTYSLIVRGHPYYDKRIDSINKDLALGMSRDILEARMQAVMASLKPKPIEALDINIKLVNRCHADKLRRKPELVDTASLYTRLTRAIRAIGPVSIQEASEAQLLDAIAKERRPGQRYHLIGAINELLRYCSRDLRLHNPSPRPGFVHYLSVEDLDAKLQGVEKAQALYLTALFATGCRLGELPMIEIQGGTCHILTQMYPDGSTGPTKNKRIRACPILPMFDEAVRQLFALGRERVAELRLTQSTSLRARLGTRLHNLRHSYAVYLAKKGVALSRIALYIGDTEAVCIKHYSRYLPSNDEIEAIRRTL